MEISFSNLAHGFADAAFVFMILALQLHMGVPPFYRSCRLVFFGGLDATGQETIKRFIPFLAGIMVMLLLFIVTEFSLFFLAAGLVAACAGLWLRRDLLRITGGPLPWVMFPLALPWVVRWPMLLFDIWTLGLALGFALLILLSSS